MQEHKNFWDKNAGRYDRFMRKDRAAYDEMYKLIRPVVKAKTTAAPPTARLIAQNCSILSGYDNRFISAISGLS